MTSEEAIYWKTYIDRVVAEKLSVLNSSQQDAVRIRQFADSFMQGINGQQLLPQWKGKHKKCSVRYIMNY